MPLTTNQKKKRIAEIVSRLEEIYPAAECALEFGGEPWKLLIMGRLSAQCTDARVNIVCRDLFVKYPTLEAIADAELSELEEAIRPCGLYRTKAASIKAACQIVRDKFGGEVPKDMDDLLALPGIGRKIANLLRGDIYGIPGIVADTHCIRLGGRFGMYDESLTDPTKVENILTDLVAPEKQTDFCHRLVFFGREWCSARAPRCAECPIADLCEHNDTKGSI